MPSMQALRLCERCRREQPDDAPEGLCPACLLRLGGVRRGILPSERPAREERRLAQQFGNYEVLEKIGQGGMGVVYKARQFNLDRIVALKLLPFGRSSEPELLERFRGEAKAAAALQHPNIVAVHEVGEHEGQPYFSMDLVAGSTLEELVRDRPLSPRRAALYLKTIAEAVHYAHTRGILHRDIKPSNILIDAADQPRITDFGLAKRLSSASDLTLTGQVLGSPNFISPEQAEGRLAATGPASDVYSLGALLYYLLTRKPPFQADTLTALLRQVLEVDPVPPRSLKPSLPKDLETICLKCLQKESARRYATAQALADDLGRFINGEPVRARPIGVASKTWRWCGRQPIRTALICGLMLAIVVGTSGISWQWRRAEQEKQKALTHQHLLLHHVCLSDPNLVQKSIEEGDMGQAGRWVDKYHSKGKSQSDERKPEADSRDWEWRYVCDLSRRDGRYQLTRFGVSPDGKYLATYYLEIRIWDLVSKKAPSSRSNRLELPPISLE